MSNIVKVDSEKLTYTSGEKLKACILLHIRRKYMAFPLSFHALAAKVYFNLHINKFTKANLPLKGPSSAFCIADRQLRCIVTRWWLCLQNVMLMYTARRIKNSNTKLAHFSSRDSHYGCKQDAIIRIMLSRHMHAACSVQRAYSSEKKSGTPVKCGACRILWKRTMQQ